MDNIMQPEILEWPCGTKIWYLNGEHHREDGPAVEHIRGDMEWWQHNKLHRTDGPAIEWVDGRKHWSLDGVSMSLNEWLDHTTGLTEEEKVMMKLQYG
jgi:hypothetical protein